MDFVIGVFTNVDHDIFNLINHDSASPFWDWLMPFVTDLHKQPIAIFIALPILLGAWIYRDRIYAVRAIVGLVLVLGLADAGSYRILKPLVNRPRPEFTQGMHPTLRTYSHTSNSFPSNHAANMFAAATFLSLAIPGSWPLVFAYAFLVAYSRIYVGVHFPSDVIGGALFGVFISYMVWKFAHQWIQGPRLKETTARYRR
jgi:undecaprenyl-diphosphatase